LYQGLSQSKACTEIQMKQRFVQTLDKLE